MSKVKTLQLAIEYINQLQGVLSIQTPHNNHINMQQQSITPVRLQFFFPNEVYPRMPILTITHLDLYSQFFFLLHIPTNYF